MRNNKIIYQLTVSDIQTVAEEIMARKLSDQEIIGMLDLIADKIPWYDAIADAIHETIRD